MPSVDSNSLSPMLARSRGRKGSYPPSFGCPGSGSPATLEVPNAASLTKRRLSHVGEAVSRRLSTTIGWRPAVSVQDVVEEAKSLCSQYIRSRLKRRGILSRKLGLQRLRSVMNMTATYGTCDVFAELSSVGKELECMHPKLYASVCRQICLTLTSEEVVHRVFTSIAQELFRADITWGKIVALFAVTAGLAADCVHQGHADYLLCLIESLGLFVETHLASWIAQQGGWNTLLKCFKPKEKNLTPDEILRFVVFPIALILVPAALLVVFIKFIK